jgi:transcriptional regulator with XRE-family HTH domain
MGYDFAGLPQRIKSAREAVDMSRETLGKLVGNLSRQAVARWEQPYTQDRNSVPDLETIAQIAEALRGAWPELRTQEERFLYLILGKRFAPDQESKGVLVPIFALDGLHDKREPIFYRRTLAQASDETDGFEVGDSSNAPDYLPHDVVITEPCEEPRPGKMMVGRLVEKRVNVFGKCVISGYGVGGKPVFDLAPISEGYPRISSKTDEIELLVVAIEHQRDLRNRS